MNEPATDQPSQTSPRRRRWIGRLWIAFAVILVLLTAAVIRLDSIVLAPQRAARDVERQLQSLAKRRPATMTKQEWDSAVSWTRALHGNSLIGFQAPAPEIRDLERRIAERLSGEVDLSTILWIWDEYAKICPHGAKYQRFREHMLEEIASSNVHWTADVP
jgi:hypothetical protein